MKKTYKLSGVPEKMMEKLTKHFGDAVHESNKEEGTMITDLSEAELNNLGGPGAGYHIELITEPTPKNQ